jgi:DNA-binding protein H-NS
VGGLFSITPGNFFWLRAEGALAMKKDDLTSKSKDELWALHEEIASILSKKINTEKLKLEKIADELASKPLPQRRFYPKVHPRFRNPEPPHQTWSGRGIQPRWVRKLLAEGKSLDDFGISQELDDLPHTKSPVTAP